MLPQSLPRTTTLKVLHIASGDRWGGAEAQALTLLSQLKSRPSIALHAVLLNDAELAERLRDAQIEVSILAESELNGWQILLGLRRQMQQWRPHVIHTHRSKENILGALANRFSINAPCVRTSHGAPEHSPQGLRQLHKTFFAKLDDWSGQLWQQRIIAVSDDLATKLTGHFSAKKIVVIENGLDIEATRALVTSVDFREREPTAIHIGLVGRLDPVKRVDIFLSMAALLQKIQTNPHLHFHIFGDGQLRTQLTDAARRLNVNAITTFHGHRHDNIACIAGLDALVICSDHEGLPMTVLEAIAVGTPVVAHAVGGLCDVLKSGKDGILVAKHEASAYAAALFKLLNLDQPDAKKIRADATVLEQYSAQRNADRILQLYAALLNE